MRVTANRGIGEDGGTTANRSSSREESWEDGGTTARNGKPFRRRRPPPLARALDEEDALRRVTVRVTANRFVDGASRRLPARSMKRTRSASPRPPRPPPPPAAAATSSSGAPSPSSRESPPRPILSGGEETILIDRMNDGMGVDSVGLMSSQPLFVHSVLRFDMERSR